MDRERTSAIHDRQAWRAAWTKTRSVLEPDRHVLTDLQHLTSTLSLDALNEPIADVSLSEQRCTAIDVAVNTAFLRAGSWMPWVQLANQLADRGVCVDRPGTAAGVAIMRFLGAIQDGAAPEAIASWRFNLPADAIGPPEDAPMRVWPALGGWQIQTQLQDTTVRYVPEASWAIIARRQDPACIHAAAARGLEIGPKHVDEMIQAGHQPPVVAAGAAHLRPLEQAAIIYGLGPTIARRPPMSSAIHGIVAVADAMPYIPDLNQVRAVGGFSPVDGLQRHMRISLLADAKILQTFPSPRMRLVSWAWRATILPEQMRTPGVPPDLIPWALRSVMECPHAVWTKPLMAAIGAHARA